MLIDASGDEFWSPMNKNLGDKRREIREEHQQKIFELFEARNAGANVKIFNTTDFMYRKIQVESPLRLNFCNSSERLERLKEAKAFVNLATSKKKDPEAKAKEEEEGKAFQQSILNALQSIPSDLVKDRDVFEGILDASFSSHGVSVKAPIKKAIFNALGERDESAEICRNKNGEPEPDTELRDHENIPFNESISDYMQREVLPHVPDAWVDQKYTDNKDGGVGRVGTEISFTRYFYSYKPPRKLSVIEEELVELQNEIRTLLRV
jgi:type I restriction enzyme M protein